MDRWEREQEYSGRWYIPIFLRFWFFYPNGHFYGPSGLQSIDASGLWAASKISARNLLLMDTIRKKSLGINF
jgi:hypothetical protein